MIRIGTVLNTIGKLILLVGTALLIPFIMSLFTGREDTFAFLFTILIMAVVGLFFMMFRSQEGSIRAKESYIIVTFGWIFVSCLGCLPYVFSGALPEYSAAFFETMSGFTTTGSTALTEIESLSPELLLWRSMTQWLGGLGVVVLFVALMSQISTGGQSMLRAELSGPYNQKMTGHIKDSAMILWGIYTSLTLILIVLLLFGGMSLFDAVCHAFSTMATGGFSTKNANIAAFPSPYIQWVIALFMFIAGVSYPLIYRVIAKRSLKVLVKNEEFRLYAIFVVVFSLFVFVDMMRNWNGTVSDNLRYSFFHVISQMTTTGFCATNFDPWPVAAHMVLMGVMLIGACYSSTSGSIKVGSYLLAFKTMRLQLFRMLHPRAMTQIKVDNQVIPEKTALKVESFITLFFVVMVLGVILLSTTGLTFSESITGAITAISNTGPAMGSLGAVGNFSEVTPFGKWVLSFLMLGGRLELYTVFVVLLPSFWRQ